jgi:large subunit ribosomal protein L3
MQTGILGRKVGMTQIFDDRGAVVPVTVIEAGPCRVVLVRDEGKDGYRAVQLGFGIRRRPNKPDAGQVKDGPAPAFRREVAWQADEAPTVGDVVTVDLFTVGERVDVTGVSRGKGFQGGVRRHHFGRGPMAHGSKYHRGPGSLSSRTSGGGGRVHPGRRMPGHMGAVRRTAQRLEVVRVDASRNLLLVKGSVPGPRRGFVLVRRTARPKKGDAR